MDQQKPDTIYVQPAQAANGLAVAAFVLGIIGLVLFSIPVIPYPLAILAIIFGGIAATKHVKKGFAITGIVTGIVTLAIKLAFWLGLPHFLSANSVQSKVLEERKWKTNLKPTNPLATKHCLVLFEYYPSSSLTSDSYHWNHSHRHKSQRNDKFGYNGRIGNRLPLLASSAVHYMHS